MPTSRVRLTPDATGVAILLCTAGLLAQQQPQQPRPTFRTEANFVRVDAFVTRDGAPVGDLTAADFDLLEDNVSQTIETFEHVAVRPAGPQETRVDPDSQRQGNELAADPRRRVFVVFLDDYHVSVQGSHAMRKPLIALLDRVVGQDDLIGVMTPAMSAAGLTLGRKTQVLEGGLTDNWIWGRRFRITDKDPKEYDYEACYAPFGREGEAVAREMIARRRERLTLDALQDLVRHLRGVREERKAIIAVSEGWIQWRPNPNLARPLKPPIPDADPVVPGTPEIFIGPGGKLRAGADPRVPSASLYGCDADRQHLAYLDNEQHFRDILDDANRANASFYPVDPRGLPVFDSPIGPDPPPDVITDARLLRGRLESLRTLAGATDGMAVMNSNDIDRGLKRMAADLTSYYLLGYYSTNPKLDGGFRSIKVRVKRPGLQVRARRGYRAATAAEVAAARSAAVSTPAAATAAASGALTAAMGRLSALRVDAPFQLHAVTARSGSGVRVWIAGELNAAAARTPEWGRGADASLLVNVRDGAGGSSRAAIEPNARSFLVSIPIQTAGDVQVQARVTPRAGDGRPVGQAVDIDPPAAGERAFAAAAPLLWRVSGGAAASPRPAANFTFSRTERVRLELPLTPGSTQTSGRVLDRTGQPLDVPVTLSERREAEDVWAVAEVNLAPLTAGDYAIEIAGERAGARETVITAIRVVR